LDKKEENEKEIDSKRCGVGPFAEDLWFFFVIVKKRDEVDGGGIGLNFAWGPCQDPGLTGNYARSSGL
jgi:hypothetical protein